MAFNDAVESWARTGRLVLEGVAGRYGGYLTYMEMAEAVQRESGIETGVPFRHWIGRVLFAISEDHQRPDEPLLTSIVVRADGTIGDGYGGPVADREGQVPPDLEHHAAEERYRCYRHFGAVLPPGGGGPMLTAQVAERRTRRRRRSPAPRPRCPTCNIDVPLAGVCDICGEAVE